MTVDLRLDVTLRNLIDKFCLCLYKTYAESLSNLSHVNHFVGCDELLQVPAPYFVVDVFSREEYVVFKFESKLAELRL